MKKIIFGNTKKIFLTFVVIYIIFVIGTSCYLCQAFSSNLSKQTEQIAVYKVQKMEFETSKTVSNINFVVQKLRKNQEFINLICEDIKTADSDVLVKKYLDEAILGVSEISGYVAISPSYKEWVHNIMNWDETEGIKLQIAFNTNELSPDKIGWYSGEAQNIDTALNNYVVCAINIVSQGDLSKRAKVYFFMDKTKFTGTFESVDDEAVTGIMNELGQVICVNNGEKFNQIIKKNKNLIYDIYIQGRNNIAAVSAKDDNYIVAYNDLSDTGLKMWCIYEKSDFYREVYKAGVIIVIVAVCVLLLLIILTALVLREYLIPINTLAKQMSKFEINDEKKKVKLVGSKEIDLIVDSYNQMIDNIYDGVEEIKRKESEKREAEYKAMRYQINPHFVYNTISSLKIIAISHGEKQISDSLTMFSRVLKYALFCNDKFTELSKEVDFVHNYISLVNVRYFGKLIADFMIDEDTLAAEIPTFLLQPIIENSIVHGLNKKLNSGECCRIKISSYLSGSNLIISVEDNGSGIESAKLSEILDGESKALTSKKSIGLKNINERIKLAYGEEYGLSIESEYGEYTRVTIVMPFAE